MSMIPIIGLGAVSAAGYGSRAAFDAVAAGRDCLTSLTLFDSALKQVPLCGQVPGDPAQLCDTTPPNRTAALALLAARESLAGLPDRGGLRLGMVLATTVGGMTRSELFYKMIKTDPATIDQAGAELAYHEPSAVAGWLARQIGACGFHTISTACSSGLHAIGMAMRLVESGRYDLCCAIGSDALSLLTVRGFASLMLIDFAGCKPFDRNRVGISLGEGAGALLLARPDTAAARVLQPLAYAAGWGASADCHHMTAPHPEGEGARRAVCTALADAGIAPAAVDLIAAHGTATPDNDLAEIRAMQKIFGTVPPFCSMKRSLGHTLAASGTLETVCAIQALQNSLIPATAGFNEPDEKIGPAPAAGGRAPLQYVLKNAFGFGGNNAAMIFSRHPGGA
jgi:3-oxoacyl-(acyl-carrier-protein) synthase